MEKSCQSLSLFEFQQHFASDNQCLAYLAAEKWKNGYVCPKADIRTIAQATISIPANVRAANTPIRLRQARCFTK
jgi:hypothetical protein